MFRLRCALLTIFIAISTLSINGFAQSSLTEPCYPFDGKPCPKVGPSLPEQIQIMTNRMTQLMEFLQTEITNSFSDWSISLAVLLTGLWLFVILKEIKSHNGYHSNVFWLLTRFGICLMLMFVTTPLINDMVKVGKDFAYGDTLGGIPRRFQDYNYENFTASYDKLTRNQFKVKIPGENEPYAIEELKTNEFFLGAIKDTTGTVRDFDNNLKNTEWQLTHLFAILSFCRALLEFADFILMIIVGFALIAFKIAAPVMVVVAADRDLAKRVAYPFTWGLIVLTLVWPVVACLLRGLAYMFGNVAMSLGDSDPAFAWNEATLQQFRTLESQPVYAVVFSCFTMAICALGLLYSHFLAYKISMGQVYEGVSTWVAQAAGTISGIALEAFTSLRASVLAKEAAQLEAQAGYDSAGVRAGGEQRATELGIKGREHREKEGIRAGADQQRRIAAAQGQLQITGVNAGRDQSLNSTHNQATLGYWNQLAQNYKDAMGLGIGYQKHADLLKGQSWGNFVSILGQYGRSIPDGGGGGGAGNIIATSGAMAGLGVGYSEQIDALAKAGNKEAQALKTYHYWMLNNGLQWNDDQQRAAHQYGDTMRPAIREFTGETIGAIDSSSNRQVKAVGYQMGLEREASQVRYDSSMEAAGITKGATIQASILRAEENVTRAIGSKLAHEIQNNMILRY